MYINSRTPSWPWRLMCQLYIDYVYLLNESFSSVEHSEFIALAIKPQQARFPFRSRRE
jgi:hypothetical protein